LGFKLHKYIYLSPIGVQWKVLVFSNLLGVKTPIQCEQKPNCFLCLGGGDPQYSTFWVKLASWLTSLIASILIITNMCIHLLPSLELKMCGCFCHGPTTHPTVIMIVVILWCNSLWRNFFIISPIKLMPSKSCIVQPFPRPKLTQLLPTYSNW
jgi:hypothetical protein